MRVLIFLMIVCISICCSGFAVAQDQPTKIEEGQIALAWGKNSETDLKGYKIYRGIESGNYPDVIDVENVNAYTMKGLVAGETYYSVLTAYDTSLNESGYSKEVSGLAKDMTAPIIPIDFRTVEIQADKIIIKTNTVEIINKN